ncbi:hypothetical protein RCL1_001165 [Eukaryota sp. TZLM3-RCL]
MRSPSPCLIGESDQVIQTSYIMNYCVQAPFLTKPPVQLWQQDAHCLALITPTPTRRASVCEESFLSSDTKEAAPPLHSIHAPHPIIKKVPVFTVGHRTASSSSSKKKRRTDY